MMVWYFVKLLILLPLVGGETRVSIEHRGFTRVPAESAARHGFPDQALQMRLAEWWRAQLASLDAQAGRA